MMTGTRLLRDRLHFGVIPGTRCASLGWLRVARVHVWAAERATVEKATKFPSVIATLGSANVAKRCEKKRKKEIKNKLQDFMNKSNDIYCTTDLSF